MGARVSRNGGSSESVPAMRTAAAAGELAVAMQAAREASAAWLASHPAHPAQTRSRSFLIIFRHRSGKTKQFIEQIVRPLLDAASIHQVVVPSKFKGSPASFFHTFDFSTTDGILVLGSDGFLNEVITGLFERFHDLPCPVGVVPCGHANALAQHLDDSAVPLSRDQSAIQAVLRAIRGECRALDIMRVSTSAGRRYALTHVGWGLPGAIAVHMDRLRWLPGHTTFDPASLITRARHWPRSRCVLSFPVEPHEAGPVTTDAPPKHPDTAASPASAPASSSTPPAAQDQWEERNFALHGLIASTLPSLGPSGFISQDVSDEDGYVVVILVPASLPKAELVRLALEMKKGKHLADSKSVVALRVREFRLVPHADLPDVPYVVDGEPMAAGAVHVRVLPRRLPVFAAPPHPHAHTPSHPHPLSFAPSRPATAFSSHTADTISPIPDMLLSGATPPEHVSQHAHLASASPTDAAAAAAAPTNSSTPVNEGAAVSPTVLVSDVTGANSDVTQITPTPVSAATAAALTQHFTFASNPRGDPCEPFSGVLSPPPSAAPGRSSCELRPRGTSPAVSVSKEEVQAYLQQASGKFMRRRNISRHFSVDELKEEDEEEERDHVEHHMLLSPHASTPVEGLEGFDDMSEVDESVVDPEEHRMRVASVVDHRQHVVHLAASHGSSDSVPSHLTIIYNPISGQGRARRVIDQMVLPVLDAARVPYTLFATQHRGHATEHVRDLDLSTTSGLVVCGGDGMVSEVVTGLMQNKDPRASDMPVGLIAVGTANAMATLLDGGRAKTKVELLANAALALARGHTTRVDVLELVTREGTRHALSCLGWAFAGEVTSQADRLRSLPLPGQKNARYEIAGIVTLAAHWPVTTEARLGYVVNEPGPDGTPVEIWKEEHISCVNLIASNLPVLGNGNPICRDIALDDGKLAVCVIDNIGRAGTVRTAMFMKRGHYLADHPLVRTVTTREFTLLPLEGTPGCTIPYNVDGDPVPAQAIRVRVLHRRLRLFSLAPDAVTTPAPPLAKARVTHSSPAVSTAHSPTNSTTAATRAQSEPTVPSQPLLTPLTAASSSHTASAASLSVPSQATTPTPALVFAHAASLPVGVGATGSISEAASEGEGEGGGKRSSIRVSSV